MSNSSLVSYTKISPNKGNWNGYRYIPERTHKIDTVTIHCVVGQCSVETLGRIFADPNKQASSNYGVGYDGRIGMYVEEKDRSWCSSNGPNDNRAITIEVASDTKHPYAVNDKAYNALIDLLVDICKRNGIQSLKWKADKSLIGQPDKQNMTVHRWFDNKACPGDYLYNRHSDIAAKVNAKLGKTPVEGVSVEKTIWNYFKSKKLNDYATAGIIGNLYAESALNPMNLQNSFEKKIGYTDVTYTKAVDTGSYNGFVTDGAGYGLAQWTYYTRKSNLLNYAHLHQKSIGDLNMQLDFLWSELNTYSSLMKTLNSAKSVKQASDAMLIEFEKPADQSNFVKNKRAQYSQAYYDKYAKKDSDVTPSKNKLEVDGIFGKLSVTAMQKWLKSTADGVISNQVKSMARYFTSVTSVTWGVGGSAVVEKLQSKVGAYSDGYIGPVTVKSLQSFLVRQGFKIDIDGYWGPDTSKAFQKYLNSIS